MFSYGYMIGTHTAFGVSLISYCFYKCYLNVINISNIFYTNFTTSILCSSLVDSSVYIYIYVRGRLISLQSRPANYVNVVREDTVSGLLADRSTFSGPSSLCRLLPLAREEKQMVHFFYAPDWHDYNLDKL